MNWNGVLGTVADVISTALPFVMGLGKADATPQDVGPATLFNKAGSLYLGNLSSGQTGAGEGGEPILVTFASPDGAKQSSMTVQTAFGDSFDVTPWLQQFSTGTVSVGLADPAPSRAEDGVLEGIWTFVTNTVLSVERTVTAVVNPTLTLNLRLEPNLNAVIITAIGAVGALGVTYMVTARNTGGQTGSRAGALESVQSTRSDQAEYRMDLPTGVDYDAGIHELSLQLPVLLSKGSLASDKSVVFEPIPQDVKDWIKQRRR